MPRASARLSPASRRSARLRSWSAMGAASMAGDATSDRAPVANALATARPRAGGHAVPCARRPGPAARRAAGAAALHARATGCSTARYARLIAALGVAEAALARAPEDRRAVLRRPGRELRDRPRRRRAARPLVVDRPRHEDPRARGRGRDRGQDRARPGVHDLVLPARLDRPRVHRRRPRDADRLRPRRRRGRAADPPAGHLQARRARSATTAGSATARASCAARRSATTRSSAPARSSPRTCPANAVVGGVPARVLRMRDAPETLRWASLGVLPQTGQGAVPRAASSAAARRSCSASEAAAGSPAAAHGAPGRARELVLAAVPAAGRDRGRVAAGLAAARSWPASRWAPCRAGRGAWRGARAARQPDRPSAPSVAGPAMPSTARPCVRW